MWSAEFSGNTLTLMEQLRCPYLDLLESCCKHLKALYFSWDAHFLDVYWSGFLWALKINGILRQLEVVCMSFPFQLCHGKTCLKIFVVVISKKKDWQTRPRQSFFMYGTNCRISFLQHCHFWVDSKIAWMVDKDLKAGFPKTQLISGNIMDFSVTFREDFSEAISWI